MIKVSCAQKTCSAATKPLAATTANIWTSDANEWAINRNLSADISIKYYTRREFSPAQCSVFAKLKSQVDIECVLCAVQWAGIRDNIINSESRKILSSKFS